MRPERRIVPPVRPEPRKGVSSGLVCCDCRIREATIGDFCKACLDALGERVRA